MAASAWPEANCAQGQHSGPALPTPAAPDTVREPTGDGHEHRGPCGLAELLLRGP